MDAGAIEQHDRKVRGDRHPVKPQGDPDTAGTSRLSRARCPSYSYVRMSRRVRLALAAGLSLVGCDLTKPLPPAVFVEPASLTLEDGQSAKITAKLRNPRSRTVQWLSLDSTIATVDPVGTVTAVANGTTTIIVRMTDDTTVTAMVPVTVIGPAVATIAVSPSTSVVLVGTLRQIAVRLRAADGRLLLRRSVSWTTPDASIAEVSSSGVVRGRGAGGPIALVATSEGHSATAQVRVAHAADRCPFVLPFALGERAEGRLALGDCELPLDNSYVDVYEFTLTESATVQVDMSSVELDAYIGLFSATGFLAEDDDSGGGRDARIVQQLAAGTYRVWANTIGGGVTGAYALTAVRR